MPRGRKRVRSTSRKRSRSRKRRRTQYGSSTRGVLVSRSFLPRQRYVSLTYSDSIQISIGALSAVNTYVLAANGLYDPDVTGTGHQPRGFDQIMALYSKYKVLGAKLIIRAHPQNTYPISVWVESSGQHTSSPISSGELAGEGRSQGCRMMIVDGTGQGGRIKTLSSYYSLKREAGASSDGIYDGNTSANPTRTHHFLVSAAQSHGVVGAGTTIDLQVIIVYRCLMFDPLAIASS